MAVDIFTVKQFDDSLPKNPQNGDKLFEHLGVIDNEHCWAWTMPDKPLRILVRSSIGFDGVSAATGEDSIRIIVQRYKNDGKWHSIGKGPDAYTTRVIKWEQRLKAKIIQVFREKIKVIRLPFYDNDILGYSKFPNSFGRPYAIPVDDKGIRGSTRYLDR